MYKIPVRLKDRVNLKVKSKDVVCFTFESGLAREYINDTPSFWLIVIVFEVRR